jgi:hypothetical protein
MGVEHTPGPWRLADGRATGFKTVSGGESILAEARPTDDFFILKVAEMETNVDEAERKANALLIASAPDLLAASEAVMKARKDYEAWVNNGPAGRAILALAGVEDESALRAQSKNAFAALAAAIAKATGRAA